MAANAGSNDSSGSSCRRIFPSSDITNSVAQKTSNVPSSSGHPPSQPHGMCPAS